MLSFFAQRARCGANYRPRAELALRGCLRRWPGGGLNVVATASHQGSLAISQVSFGPPPPPCAKQKRRAALAARLHPNTNHFLTRGWKSPWPQNSPAPNHDCGWARLVFLVFHHRPAYYHQAIICHRRRRSVFLPLCDSDSRCDFSNDNAMPATRAKKAGFAGDSTAARGAASSGRVLQFAQAKELSPPTMPRGDQL